ncbi:MAG: hypothetical protein KAS32_30125 [Candidatus Peribacteraceae bacterium]|nr:hypothetical protein [Candidatus Peribacteraceae bacterium]
MNKEEEEFINVVHGEQVTWIGVKKLSFDAIILLSKENGLSIKPIDEPSVIRSKFIEAWGFAPFHPTPEDDNFCLSSSSFTIAFSEREILMEAVRTNIYRATGNIHLPAPTCKH